MPRKTKPPGRQPVGIRLDPDALDCLERLQAYYGQRAGLTTPLSQSATVSLALRETAKTYRLLEDDSS